MIEISYKQKLNLSTFIIKGHAGYNPGNDIVCSAVSTLTYTLAGYLQNNDSKLEFYRYDLKSGDAVVEYIPKYNNIDEINAITEAIYTGYRMLQESYPNNVKMI